MDRRHGMNEFLHGLLLKPGTRRSPGHIVQDKPVFRIAPVRHHKLTQFRQALRVLFREIPVHAGPCLQNTAQHGHDESPVLSRQYGQPQISLPRGRRPEGIRDDETHARTARPEYAVPQPEKTSRLCGILTEENEQTAVMLPPHAFFREERALEIRQRPFLPVTENPGKPVTAARVAEAVVIQDIGRAVHGREIIDHVVIGLFPEKDSQRFRAIQFTRRAQPAGNILQGFFPGCRPEEPFPTGTDTLQGRTRTARKASEALSENGFGTQASTAHGRRRIAGDTQAG